MQPDSLPVELSGTPQRMWGCVEKEGLSFTFVPSALWGQWCDAMSLSKAHSAYKVGDVAPGMSEIYQCVLPVQKLFPSSGHVTVLLFAV